MSKARDIANILSANTAIATDAEVTAAISAATSGLATTSSVSTAVTNERTATATLTNKTLSSPTITIPSLGSLGIWSGQNLYGITPSSFIIATTYASISSATSITITNGANSGTFAVQSVQNNYSFGFPGIILTQNLPSYFDGGPNVSVQVFGPVTSTVSSVELSYIDGLTSPAQSQLDAKAAAIDFSNTAWTSYTPSLRTNGGTITLGNGSVEGAYKQLGKTVHFRAKFTIGSTTAIGANEIVIGLPVNAASSDYSFAGAALDGGNAWYSLTGVGRYLGLTNEFAMISHSGTGKIFVGVSNSSMFPLLTGDYITISGSYEAA